MSTSAPAIPIGLTTKKAPFIEQARAKGDIYIPQPYELYSEENQDTWRRLCARIKPKWEKYAHPKFLEDGRMLVGLYSDGFSFSLVAYTDNLGKTWEFSDPIVGGGNIQPSFAVGRNGVITTYRRDNGLAPKRVMVSESHDR